MKKQIIVDKDVYLSTFKNRKLGLFSLKKYKNWFPIRSTPIFAGIVADVTGDGHLGKGIIQYISKNKTEVIRFNTEIRKLFGINGKIRRSPSNKSVWESVIGNSALSRILKMSDTPFGEKVTNKFYAPSWVLNGNKKIKKRYVQRLFDCEGSLYFQKRKRVRIKFKMHKSIQLIKNHRYFLNQIRNILSEFGVRTTNLTIGGYTKRKDGIITIGLEFEICGTKRNLISIINFQKNINFESKIKREKLNKYINELKNALES